MLKALSCVSKFCLSTQHIYGGHYHCLHKDLPQTAPGRPSRVLSLDICLAATNEMCIGGAAAGPPPNGKTWEFVAIHLNSLFSCACSALIASAFVGFVVGNFLLTERTQIKFDGPRWPWAGQLPSSLPWWRWAQRISQIRGAGRAPCSKVW